MKRIAVAILGAGAVSFAAQSASAFPRITVTACDTVSTSPLQVRTTFTVDIPGPSGPWCEFLMVAQPGTGTELLGCVAVPADFRCDTIPSGALGGPAPTLYFSLVGRCFVTNDHFEGFQILANRSDPCVYIKFSGPLLLEGGYTVNGLDGSYGISACLIKDGPVPATSTSWGQLKSLYR